MLAESREALSVERDRVLAQIATLQRDVDRMMAASEDSNADDEHDPEGATIAFERAQLAALLAATRARLADVETALSLLDQGGYGRCQDCGRPIDPERLVARPTARQCIECARSAGSGRPWERLPS